MIDVINGFNLIYAKSGESPKHKFFKTKNEVIDFLLINLNKMDFLSINEMNININMLINTNLYLSRYIKLISIYEI